MLVVGPCRHLLVARVHSQGLNSRVDSATLSLLIAGISAQDDALTKTEAKTVTQNMSWPPELRLLILRNLLKTRIGAKIPA
jgi:hypothetical protein